MRTELIVAMACLVFAGNALGATLRVDFGGSVYLMQGHTIGASSGPIADPAAAIGGSVQIGGRFSGYLILDDATEPDFVWPESSDPLLPEAAVYRFAWPDSVLHIEVGDFVRETSFENLDYPTGGFSIEVQDYELYTPPGSESLIRAHAFLGEPAPGPGGSFVPTQMQLDFVGGAPGLPLHSTSLATIPWNRTSFPTGYLHFYFHDGEGSEVEVGGILDQLSSTPVPEPALGALGLVALLGLGFRRAQS